MTNNSSLDLMGDRAETTLMVPCTFDLMTFRNRVWSVVESIKSCRPCLLRAPSIDPLYFHNAPTSRIIEVWRQPRMGGMDA